MIGKGKEHLGSGAQGDHCLFAKTERGLWRRKEGRSDGNPPILRNRDTIRLPGRGWGETFKFLSKQSLVVTRHHPGGRVRRKNQELSNRGEIF